MDVTVGNAPSQKNNYLYNNKELQAGLGLYDYGARLYDPVIGRWTSVDPVAESNADETGYSYVDNSPGNYMDAGGLFKIGKDLKDFPNVVKFINQILPLLKNNAAVRKAMRLTLDYAFSDGDFNNMVSPGKGPTIHTTEKGNDDNENVDNSSITIRRQTLVDLEETLKKNLKTGDRKNLDWFAFKFMFAVLHESTHWALKRVNPKNWYSVERYNTDMGSVFEYNMFKEKFSYKNINTDGYTNGRLDEDALYTYFMKNSPKLVPPVRLYCSFHPYS